ncbi:aminomethyl-transferring glycine dehydrogenase [Modestobacter sp. I12A-02628]|uniref:Glycine dehydrogenase (decarboxylating) n=1 Tax=Goekera deserti TaxID=2497753 RepID=A0A7K3WEC7_9ACTN|nr:aminomethyl-transferring glycine dehydrogenase [Goekera deserti]MPQ99694.1 aminomethyl-transferring glycine dehydrogenase [Goekera deserti]NDI46296.1 aminomethyl-transferring glycine dehydrogenase [Goekera deserti]NEL54772.1 aminomethyl-transferring glycine dehydrogenase [Goekera deserti]
MVDRLPAPAVEPVTSSLPSPSGTLPALSHLHPAGEFAGRHIGPRPADTAAMLEVVGRPTLEALVDACVPDGVRDRTPLDVPAALDEAAVLAQLRERADANEVFTSMIGLGYSGTITPSVVQRCILENPAWYTAYTPYQPEISQGRLEALINFQTVVADLTGLPVAGASMLDEATAAAEAMTLVRRAGRATADAVFVVDADTLPQTLAVLRTRAEPLGIVLHVADLTAGWPTDLPAAGAFGVLLAYPGASGAVRDHRALATAAHEAGAAVVVAADLLALTLLEAPGEWGADVACGTSQRFGVPMGYGGPHAGYLSVREGLARQLPGRLVGVSVDADGDVAYRLALQTREQHIRREKATSNICTAQVLLAVMAGAYAVYHGPDGLTAIAARVHRSAQLLARWLTAGGLGVVHEHFFDTVTVAVPGRAAEVVAAAAEQRVNLRLVDADTVAVACDETTSLDTLRTVAAAFGVQPGEADLDGATALPEQLHRRTPFLTHPVFAEHRSETAMLRYLRRLSDKDLALDRTMIPLGSCTMKLNAATEMAAVSWPEFAGLHPFAPVEQARGYAMLIEELCQGLAEITGYAAVSVQPNAGSQGEFAGLLAIRGYHRSRGDVDRDVCLIPSSAHGTNAASAVMAGMRVVVVACDEAGNVDVADLHAKVEQHADRLAALMITYPSTHGVFETAVQEICAAVHDAGGQVYVDGANLNALVGLAKPGRFGSDVSHLNLHKTFCIPHGGGGPGVGPIGVAEHLVPFLPGHPLVPTGGEGPAVSGAPWGSAGILPISWAYLRLMGPDGLLRATEHAILAANYVAARLREHYPVLYTGADGLVAHECILDIRPITKTTGVTNDDIAKRLVDYGFHAPTMSFPVAGTLMVEPTESEDRAELDRFVDAMIAIRGEIEKVATGEFDRTDNPLRNAPHTLAMLTGTWERPYDRAVAVYPVPGLVGRSYLAPVRRIDGAYGDRNLVCSCPSPEAFEEMAAVAAPTEQPAVVPDRVTGAPDDLGTTADVVPAGAQA